MNDEKDTILKKRLNEATERKRLHCQAPFLRKYSSESQLYRASSPAFCEEQTNFDNGKIAESLKNELGNILDSNEKRKIQEKTNKITFDFSKAPIQELAGFLATFKLPIHDFIDTYRENVANAKQRLDKGVGSTVLKIFAIQEKMKISEVHIVRHLTNGRQLKMIFVISAMLEKCLLCEDSTLRTYEKFKKHFNLKHGIQFYVYVRQNCLKDRKGF